LDIVETLEATVRLPVPVVAFVKGRARRKAEGEWQGLSIFPHADDPFDPTEEPIDKVNPRRVIVGDSRHIFLKTLRFYTLGKDKELANGVSADPAIIRGRA
jgi:hypothetical protein